MLVNSVRKSGGDMTAGDDVVVQKKKVVTALKKARSGVDKTLAMLEDERACFDIIQQNLAAIGLLKSANALMLEQHIAQIISSANGDVNADALAGLQEELMRTIRVAQNK